MGNGELARGRRKQTSLIKNNIILYVGIVVLTLAISVVFNIASLRAIRRETLNSYRNSFHSIAGSFLGGLRRLEEVGILLANDPVCHELWGFYRWRLEEGSLTLTMIEDKCAIGLRAMNLTHLPWVSCQPPNIEAAITEHWPKPAGCD